MIRFSYEIIVPADTQEEAPVVEKYRLDRGTIVRCWVRFRFGCHNHVYLAVYDGLYQIIPASGGVGLYGDGTTFDIPLRYELRSPPFEISIYGWSPTSRYNHTISIWFDLDPKDNGALSGLLSSIVHLGGIKQ